MHMLNRTRTKANQSLIWMSCHYINAFSDDSLPIYCLLSMSGHDTGSNDVMLRMRDDGIRKD